jgi:hypothetical protein
MRAYDELFNGEMTEDDGLLFARQEAAAAQQKRNQEATAAKEAALKPLLAELGGDNPRARAIAEGLQKQGIGSTKDIGVRQIPEIETIDVNIPDGSDAGWHTESQRVPTGNQIDEFFNKSTGSTINPARLGIIQNGTGGVKGGDIFFHLRSDNNGNVSFEPQWSPRAHGFLRDNPFGQAIMALGALIPSPIQPFVMAAKGADTLAHASTPLGYLSGLASLAGAGLTGAGLIGGPDIVGSDWAAGAPTTGLGNATLPVDVTAGSYLSTLKDVAGGLKNAVTGANVVNAVDKGNLAGAVNALTSNSNLAGGLGSTPIGGTGFNLGDVGTAASLASNLASGNPNIGAALGSAGSLAGNQDLSNIGKAVSLGQGIMSGNPMSALNSMVGLGKLGSTGFGSTTAPIDDRSTSDTQFDTSAFNSSFQQPVSPDLSAINTSGTNTDLTAINAAGGNKVDDYEVEQYLQSLPSGYSDIGLGGYDFDSSDLSNYISSLDLGGLGSKGGVTLPNADGTMPEGAFTSADQERLNEIVAQQYAEQQPPPAAETSAVATPPNFNTGLYSGLDSSFGDTPERPAGVGPLAVWSPTTGMWEERDDEGNVLKYTRSGTLLTDRGTGPGFDASGKPIAGIPQKLTTATTPTKATAPAKTATTPAKTGTGAPSNQPQGTGLGSLLPLLLMMLAANQSKGSSAPASSATIPALTATQTQTPYTSQTQSPTYRPGQGGISYFNPVQYTPKMAAGGIAGLGAASGRFLKGAGDGVSDSIPATIGSNQPARLARGEFVVDARTVSELGNGSSEAGADKLLKMMERVHQARKKAGRGQDSHADRHMPA